MHIIDRLHYVLTRTVGKLTGRHYFEDFVRVYPDDIVINRLGLRRPATELTRNNYLNHRKFYEFAAQFAQDKHVVDVGCGSGYGCDVLKRAGATAVFGCDVSRPAIRFARSRFADSAEFSVQEITDLREYADHEFDVTI